MPEDEIQLERRLGLIEAAQATLTQAVNLNHSEVMRAIGVVEGKIEVQNGTVKRHEEALIRHSDVPHGHVSAEEQRRLIGQIEEMWTAWSIGKWVGSGAVLALMGQTTALLIFVLKG